MAGCTALLPPAGCPLLVAPRPPTMTAALLPTCNLPLTAVPSGSSHSSFTVEFRDSSNSHSQVEGASASASGVEFQITQGSSSIMPSTAMSDLEENKEGAGRDGALEHVRMLCF